MKTKSLKLSSNLLQMKFMKKTAIQTQEELALEDQKQEIDDEHWYLDLPEVKSKSDVIPITIEQSYTVLNGLVFGRMSFKGFNPQIEKLMRKDTDDEDDKDESDSEKEIDDKSMAKTYESVLLKKVSKRFSNKLTKKVKRLGQKM